MGAGPACWLLWKCLALAAGTSLLGLGVTRKLMAVMTRRAIVGDKGAELTGMAVPANTDRRAPGKPMQHAAIECHNGSLFASLSEVREKISVWRQGHNRQSPCSSSGNLTPHGFVLKSILKTKAV